MLICNTYLQHEKIHARCCLLFFPCLLYRHVSSLRGRVSSFLTSSLCFSQLLILKFPSVSSASPRVSCGLFSFSRLILAFVLISILFLSRLFSFLIGHFFVVKEEMWSLNVVGRNAIQLNSNRFDSVDSNKLDSKRVKTRQTK